MTIGTPRPDEPPDALLECVKGLRAGYKQQRIDTRRAIIVARHALRVAREALRLSGDERRTQQGRRP